MGMIGNTLAQGLVSGANIVDGTVDTVDIKDAAVTTAKLNDGAATGAKLGSDVVKTTGDQTVAGVKTFSSAPVLPAASIPQAALAANVAGNGPAFSAYKSTGQSFSSATLTKVTFDLEEFDTNSNFASSRFTPTVAGYYFINGELDVYNQANLVFCSIYKNGSDFKRGTGNNATNSETYTAVSALVYLNGTTDYVELYVYANGGTPALASAVMYSYFQGFLARAA